MKRNGADTIGFDIIIASGKRSALSPWKASGKQIEKGDFILIDFGSGFQGYHSDQTRTLFVAIPPWNNRKSIVSVKEAHDRALRRSGRAFPLAEVDTAAREYIRNQGYGEYFGPWNRSRHRPCRP